MPFVGYGKGGDGFPPARFAKMAQSDCQLVMGFPVDLSNPNLPPNVEATSAYASTGFVLVRLRGSATMSLGALPKGSEVGIAQLDTYAGLLFGTHPNIVMHVYPKDSLMLADLDAKRIAAGLAWQPSIELYAQQASRRSRRSALRICPASTCSGTWWRSTGRSRKSAADLFDRGLYELQSKRAAAAADQAVQPGRRGGSRVPARRDGPNRGSSTPSRLEYESGAALSPSPNQDGKARSKHKKVPALYTEDQAAKGAHRL